MSVGNVEIPDGARSANDSGVRQIVDESPVLACSLTAQLEVELVSQSLLDYFGKTLDELRNWTSIGVVHPNNLEAVIAQIRDSAETGESFDFENRCRRYDGVFRCLQAHGLPLRNAQGQIERWYVLLIDVEDKRRAQDALRKSERSLNLIINTIPEMAWSTGPDGSVDFLNQRWLDYTGFTADQALGWNWATALHPDDIGGLTEHWKTILESGVPGEYEARLRRFDGVYRWFLIRANPLRDESGNVIKWCGINIDIEERKRADESLRASERTLNLIINAIPMLAWSTTPTGSVEFLSQRWLEFTGLSAEQASGFGWSVAIHPDDKKDLLDYWLAALASGTDVDVEARMRRFDGQYRWFLFRASPLRDESGKIVKWYGTNVDIEDRKRADEELRRSEAFLAEGQKLSGTGTFAWRPDTAKSVWSAELYRIHEIEPGTAISPDIAEIGVHPDDITLVYEAVARGVETGSDYEHTHRIVLPNGRTKFLHVMARATRDSEGHLEYIGAVQDVTQRMFSEEALSKSRSELAHITRVMSLGILTASIAHEVNQPLAGIITNAETCLQMLDDNPPDIAGARETALRSIRDGNRASDVIARLRSLFKRNDFVAEVIDLNEATREVIALSSGELRRSRMALQTELVDDLPPVNGDRVQLQQVIMNLLRNAIDATREIEDRPRQLLIQTERDGAENVRLSIQDTGTGFAPETADRLFESFYSTKNDGMGIGLAISRSIIEAHHGQIWATLNHGPGATFAFSIPRGTCCP